MHVPLVVHWPTGIAARGEVRDQFHYVTDIAPTVLEVAGVELPESYRGTAQMPMAGSSIAYAFDRRRRAEPQDLRSTSRWVGTARCTTRGGRR